MDTTALTYLSLIISLIGLGISIYAIKRSSSSSAKVQEIEPKAESIIETKIESEPMVIIEKKVLESNPVLEIEFPRPIKKIRPTKLIIPPVNISNEIKTILDTPKITPKVLSNLTNHWELKVIGPDGKPFSIQVEWSDTSLDVINGIVPENYDFNHQYGTIPVKVVGISPSGDKGLHYQWKLNEFHWS